jgi:hypothetical protein
MRIRLVIYIADSTDSGFGVKANKIDGSLFSLK